MQHDADAALAFLRLLADGPWNLVALHPMQRDKSATDDQRRPRGASIGGEHALTDLSRFLAVNADRNVYYALNATSVPGAIKTRKHEVTHVRYLHVDKDPDAGKDAEAERVRIINEFTRGYPGLPPPTYLVDSGGGINAAWAMQPWIPVEGETAAEREASAERYERYNIKIERICGADHCHNLDRILRLPGTINWPDPKKLEKQPGRAPRAAKLLWFDPARRYTLDQFQAEPKVQIGPQAASRELKLEGPVVRIQDESDLDALGDRGRLTTEDKELIVTGEIASKPGRFKSRSEALFRAICQMIRAGFKNESIYAIITDERFAISASVLEAKSPEKYALRQIRNAREKIESPEISFYNERHTIIRSIGGKCRVIEWVTDPVMKGRRMMTKQDKGNFYDGYADRTMTIKVTDHKSGQLIDKTIKSAQHWFESPRANKYDRIVFAPEMEIPGALNLWQGFTVRPTRGPGHESFLAFVRDIICSGVQEHYDYLINWMALAVQHPATLPETAVIMRGIEGSGKNFFADAFGELFGSHYATVVDPKHLTGNFNSHLRDCVLLFGDEAWHANDKTGQERLKSIVTGKRNMIEGKGIDTEDFPNFIKLLLATNNRHVVPTGPDARRWLLLDVSPAWVGLYDNFARVSRDLREHDGLAHLLQFLLDVKLGKWQPNPVPKTEGLVEQRELTLEPEEEWWYHKLAVGVLMPGIKWGDPLDQDELFRDYVNYVGDLSNKKKINQTTMMRFLRRVTPPDSIALGMRRGVASDPWGRPGGAVETRVPVMVLPPLAECREVWARTQMVGRTVDWPDYSADLTELVAKKTTEIPF